MAAILMNPRIPVSVLGATGAVGQRFVQLLDRHPWFEVVALTGSDRSVGQTYGEACHWIVTSPMPDWARSIAVTPTLPGTAEKLAFSALPASIAREVEPLYAQSGCVVCSNASAFRQEPDVPIILPEVNPDHTSIVLHQKESRGWQGFIVTNPNCTSTGMTVALKALQNAFSLQKVFAVSLQAISGAGYPGVPSLDIVDNVIPYIQGEEEKVELEPRKMLGQVQGNAFRLADFKISAHTNRVAVSEGHMVCLSVEFTRAVENMQEVAEALAHYKAPAINAGLPSAPKPVILLRTEPDRPQPRLDRLSGAGMTTVVGRLRSDPLLHARMVVLSHNTIRGAAGGSIYNAELLFKQGLISA